MLALDPQQASQPVAPLLESTAGEEAMKIAVTATFQTPDPAEVGDHVAHRRLSAVAGEAGAQEADHLPVLGGQDPSEVLGPFRWVDQASIAVGEPRRIRSSVQRSRATPRHAAAAGPWYLVAEGL